ncbi:MAG: RHS repeat-associated core domain-containing protein [Planctomycetota bacterium]
MANRRFKDVVALALRMCPRRAWQLAVLAIMLGVCVKPVSAQCIQLCDDKYWNGAGEFEFTAFFTPVLGSFGGTPSLFFDTSVTEPVNGPWAQCPLSATDIGSATYRTNLASRLCDSPSDVGFEIAFVLERVMTGSFGESTCPLVPDTIYWPCDPNSLTPLEWQVAIGGIDPTQMLVGNIQNVSATGANLTSGWVVEKSIDPLFSVVVEQVNIKPIIQWIPQPGFEFIYPPSTDVSIISVIEIAPNALTGIGGFSFDFGFANPPCTPTGCEEEPLPYGPVGGAQPGEWTYGLTDLSDPIDLSTGDYQLTQTDAVVKGRGMNFTFTRTYRARSGTWSVLSDGSDPEILDEPLGMNWDHNWNVYVLPGALRTPSGAGEESARDSAAATLGCTASEIRVLDFFPGNGRSDAFFGCVDSSEQPTSQFIRDEYHTSFEFSTGSTDGALLYRSPDGSTHEFFPLAGSSANQGRLKSITDRRGNAFHVAYKPADDNRIASVRHTTSTGAGDREILFTYHDDPMSPLGDTTKYAHLLWKVTDFAGREVEYLYEDHPEDNGTTPFPERLIEVRLPEVQAESVFDVPSDLARFSGEAPGSAQPRRRWQFDWWGNAAPDPEGSQPTEWWAYQLKSVTSPNGDVVVWNDYSFPGGGASSSGAPSRNNYRIETQRVGEDLDADGLPDDVYNYVCTDLQGNRFGEGTPSDAFQDDYVVWVNDRKGQVTALVYAGLASSFNVPGTTTPFVHRRLIRRIDFPGVAPSKTAPSSGSLSHVGSDPSTLQLSSWAPVGGNAPVAGALSMGAALGRDFDYNDDWHSATSVDPNGDLQSRTYVEGTDRRKAGALKELVVTDAAAGQTITEEWAHNFDFSSGGCCGSDFPTAYKDEREYVTRYVYDETVDAITGVAKGDLLSVYHDLPIGTSVQTMVFDDAAASETFEYNNFGQRTAHVQASNGTNRRRDEYTYYASGIENGYLESMTADVGGFALETRFEYNRVGDITGIIEPDGHYTERVFNQARQLVRERRFEAKPTTPGDLSDLLAQQDFFYDANGNLVRDDVHNLVPVIASDGAVTGYVADAINPIYTTLHEYDVLDYRVRTAREISGFDETTLVAESPSGAFSAATYLTSANWAITEYEYDANKNLITIRHPEAVNGSQVFNCDVMRYDERDLLVRRYSGVIPTDVDDDGVWTKSGGDPTYVPLITEYTYDLNGRRTAMAVNPDALGGEGEQKTTTVFDGFDRPIMSTDPMGNQTFYEYDDNGNVLAIATCGPAIADTDPSSTGNALLSFVEMIYDVRDRETTRSVALFGATSPPACTYAGDGIVPNPTGVSWQVTTTLYNENDSVASVEYESGDGIGGSIRSQTQYSYDTASRLARTTDAKGNLVEYFYDAGSNLIGTGSLDKDDTGPSGDERYMTVYAYDGLDRMIVSVEGSYANFSGSSLSVDLPSGATDYADALAGPQNDTYYAHDSRGNQIVVTDPNGHVTEQAYDGLNRPTQTTVKSGSSTTLSGADAVNTLGGDDLVTQVGYDASSRIISRTDDSTNATRYVYDGLGREQLMRMADGTVHQMGSGFDVAWGDGELAPSSFGGFASGYNTVGNITALTDARGVKQTLAYDLNNRLETRVIDTSALTPAQQASFGGALSESFTYDGLGRILTADNFRQSNFTDPIAEVARAYGSRSNLFEEKIKIGGDPARTVAYVHDTANNQTRCTYPSGRQVSRAYDQLNRLIGIDEGFLYSSSVTTNDIAGYGYVGQGRVRQRVSGDDSSAGSSNRGLVFSGYKGASTGSTFGFGHTSLIFTTGPGTGFDPVRGANFQFFWDAAGNRTSHVALTGVTAARSRAFGYDEADRLVSSSYFHTAAGPGDYYEPFAGTMLYTLDGVHNRESVLLDNGSMPFVDGGSIGAQYAQDTENQPVNQYSAAPDWARYAYDDSGSLTLAADRILTADFDADGDVDAADFTTSQVEFGSGCAYLSGTTDDWQCECDSAQGHDGMFVDLPQELIDQGYGCPDSGASTIVIPLDDLNDDGIADRYCGVVGDTNGDCVVESSDFLDTLVEFGRVTDRVLHVYDWRNQLISVTGYSGQDVRHASTYMYDAFNRRMRADETVNTYNASGVMVSSDQAIIEFTYGGQNNWQLLAEYKVDPQGVVGDKLLAEYVYGNYIDEVLQMRRDGKDNGVLGEAGDDIYYYHHDDLFSVYAITDESGAIVERYDYGDYGTPAILNAAGFDVRDLGGINPGTGLYELTGGDGVLDAEELAEVLVSAIGNRHTFTGRLYDHVTGLVQYRHRYLHPSIGRFVQRDPLGYVDGMNLFEYVRSTPLVGVDPMGLQFTATGRSQSTLGGPLDPGLFGPVTKGDLIRHEQEQRELFAEQKRNEFANALDAQYYSLPERLGDIGLGLGEFGAGFVPWLGDYLEARNLANPNAPWWSRGLSGASLVANAHTGGVAPNFGPIASGIGRIYDAILFGQRRIGRRFGNNRNAPEYLRGRLLSDVSQDLNAGILTPDDLPLNVFEYNSQYITINNRSFGALSDAGMHPTIVHIKNPTPDEFRRLFENTIINTPLPGHSIPITPSTSDLTVERIIVVPDR